MTPRIAFARLWAAWKNSGEITVTEVIPEWLPEADGPHRLSPPQCLDAIYDGWTCITHDGTGFWCSACIAWSEEHAALVESGEAAL